MSFCHKCGTWHDCTACPTCAGFGLPALQIRLAGGETSGEVPVPDGPELPGLRGHGNRVETDTMSENVLLSERARKLLDQIGWPEWTGRTGYKYRLQHNLSGSWCTLLFATDTAGFEWHSWLTQHEAACLIEHRLREYLASEGLTCHQPFDAEALLAAAEAELKEIEIK